MLLLIDLFLVPNFMNVGSRFWKLILSVYLNKQYIKGKYKFYLMFWSFSLNITKKFRTQNKILSNIKEKRNQLIF